MLEPMTGWACREPPMARCPDPAQGDTYQTSDVHDVRCQTHTQGPTAEIRPLLPYTHISNSVATYSYSVLYCPHKQSRLLFCPCKLLTGTLSTLR